VADDAGALLVRSGLVSANALDDARARVDDLGGTVGEQLVVGGAIGDEALTEFYRTRLLVPQVNPNLLARLTPKVVATMPGDMAIELRAIPVSLDGDNNLTVAMSDPSDRHAVDEIAFFTGAYVVRAVATQMQIAWCLAHYYGHVTPLGQRLLHGAVQPSPIKAAISAAARVPRTKGLTGKVDAARHRAIAPITGPVNVIRPNSGELDLRPLAAGAAGAAAPPSAAAPPPAAAPSAAMSPTSIPTLPRITPPAPSAAMSPTSIPALPRITPPAPSAAARPVQVTPPPGLAPRLTPLSAPPPVATRAGSASTGPATAPLAAAPLISPPRSTAAGAPPPMPPAAPPRAVPASTPPPAPSASGSVPRAAPDAITLPPIDHDEPPPIPPSSVAPGDGAPDKPRARSVSGEIRVPNRRAASIRPPLPANEPSNDDDDDDEPLIVIEAGTVDEEATGPRKLPAPPRRRAVQSDPPELYARAGEVNLKHSNDRAIDADEPRIVIDEDALAPPTRRSEPRDARDTAPPVTIIDVIDDIDTGALIHDRVADHAAPPTPLDPRTMTDQLRAVAAATLATIQHDSRVDDDDTSEIDIVVLDAPKPKPTRPERRTQHGVPPAPGAARSHRDTQASGVPTMVEHRDADHTHRTVEDPTSIDLRAAPPGEETQSDQLAAPPDPARDDDTNPHLIAAPPAPAARTTSIQRAVLVDDDDDEPSGPRTSVMSNAELDDAIPQRTAEILPGHLGRHRIDYDPVDDGWGPPGTTIPPPLLGAIPGSGDDDDDDDDGGREALNIIPLPNVDSSPLIVGLPSRSLQGDSGGRALVRALEDATARAIEVIRQLERAESRDQVVDLMIAHLAETHHRAGFFVTRQGTSKGAIELGLFSMTPRPAVMPFANLRLDRPSTLQDVVGTRLPYRGPMHDDASRAFLVSILGACPAEILLVPVAVRERVVGVLFGEHRQRHTFDDQLALAARAAGMALERILKAKRT
jgi:Type II secretion system (T2SS), protein E, N-terminal domain